LNEILPSPEAWRRRVEALLIQNFITRKDWFYETILCRVTQTSHQYSSRQSILRRKVTEALRRASLIIQGTTAAELANCRNTTETNSISKNKLEPTN